MFTITSPCERSIDFTVYSTNVLYAFGNGSISALAFNQEKATATSDMIDWQVDAARNALPFDGNLTYQPVMGVSVARLLQVIICFNR